MSTVTPLSPWIEILHPTGSRPVVLLCDHAGREVPEGLGFLGISERDLARHIGWDIGAAAVTRELAGLLDATAVLCHTSRLLIDVNRRPGIASSIPERVDGTEIPGNRDLSPAEVRRRIRRYWLPYHRTVARVIGRLRRRGRTPAVIAVHSFTPRLNGEARPWQIGILWRGDDRLSRPVLDALSARGDLCIGDNRPYSGLENFGYTIEFHAQRPRLPHLMIELRQDCIAHPAEARKYAEILAEVLAAPLADPALYSPFEGDNLAELQARYGVGRIGWRHLAHLSRWA